MLKCDPWCTIGQLPSREIYLRHGLMIREVSGVFLPASGLTLYQSYFLGNILLHEKCW